MCVRGVCPGGCVPGVCVCLWGGVCHIPHPPWTEWHTPVKTLRTVKIWHDKKAFQLDVYRRLPTVCVLVSSVAGCTHPLAGPLHIHLVPLRDTYPPPPDKPLADTCDYITCPQLLLWVVITSWHPLWLGATNPGSATKTWTPFQIYFFLGEKG